MDTVLLAALARRAASMLPRLVRALLAVVLTWCNARAMPGTMGMEPCVSHVKSAMRTLRLLERVQPALYPTFAAALLATLEME